MKQNLLSLGLAGMFASLVATSATAAPLTFSGSADFLAAISGATAQGTDLFSGLTNGADLGAGPLSRSAGALAYQISDPQGFYAGLSSGGFLTNLDRTSTMTAAGFGANVNVFGANFFGSNFSGAPVAGESIAIHVLENDGDVFDITLTAADRASYFGYIGNSALSSVSVRSLNVAPLWPSIDNLTLARVDAAPAAVPEPTSLAISLTALGLLAAGRLRRRTTAA